MGHRFNPMLTSLLRHSNNFDQSNRVFLPKRGLTHYRQEESRSVKNQLYLVYGINKDKCIKLKAYIKYFNK